MLPEEGRDLDMLLLGQLAAMLVEPAGGTLGGLRNSRIPGRSGLDRTARRGVVIPATIEDRATTVASAVKDRLRI